MRVLIIGNLAGQLSAATKLAFDQGAKVLHAQDAPTAMELLRTGRGADIVMIDVHEDINGLVNAMKQERIVAPVVACGVNVTPDMAASAIRSAPASRAMPRPCAGSPNGRRGSRRMRRRCRRTNRSWARRTRARRAAAPPPAWARIPSGACRRRRSTAPRQCGSGSTDRGSIRGCVGAPGARRGRGSRCRVDSARRTRRLGRRRHGPGPS